ncbi:MAG: chemotaxis protein CheA [Nitrospinae bacterium]|nr:chemotaxis protein CheA [Nitrospinota bacterium]
MSDLSNEQIEIIQDFVRESRDTLEQLEQSIIELGKGTGDPAAINVIFRLFHSMKGTSSFLDLRNISAVSHAAENLLDLIRSGTIELKYPEHVDLLIQATDFAMGALRHVETHLNDNDLAGEAGELKTNLHAAVEAAKSGSATPAPKTIKMEAPAPQKPKAEAKKVEAPAPAQASPKPAAAAPPPPPPPSSSRPSAPSQEYYISPEMVERFIQESDELLQKLEGSLLDWIKTPSDKEVVSSAFRHIHSFKGNCGFFGYADLERLSHQMENLLDMARSGAFMNYGAAAELLLQMEDVLKTGLADITRGGTGVVSGLGVYLSLLKEISAPSGAEGEEESPKIGEILVNEGVVKNEDLNKALEMQRKPLGEILVDMGVTNANAVETALKKQRKATSDDKSKKSMAKRQDIRVDLDKLDNLITLIGELVIAENMLVNNPDLVGLELENFHKAAQQTSKIVRDLQELAMVIRMVPVSGLFRRMIRLVHDLSIKCGKKVDLQLSGEETEVDKTIIEILTDPLVHMIRNSIDHGVETPEDRKAAGKPETGIVRLSASHEEGEVWIVIEDDGKGLNREKILAKAVSMGMVGDDADDMSDKETFALIFAPGFSTAEQVSDVSGRGVGMDVVKQNLDKINCKIEVSSKPGLGARFALRIPLTLAIIDGMLIRVGASKYILPIISIRESFSPAGGAITRSTDGQELVRVREEFLPVVRLHEIHKLAPDSQDLCEGILIVMDTPEGNMALFVDEILGQQQTVIKGLSKYISDVGKVRGVSGCTILGNGDVCLILDVGGLVESPRR